MQSNWLKVVGMGKSGKPIEDDWKRHIKNGLLERAVMFPRNPKKVRVGDRIVLYAAGHPRVIFAAGEVTGYPHPAPDGGPDYPWLADIVWDDNATLPLVHYGVALSDIGIDGRRVRQKSHITLTDDEFRAAVRALRRAKERLGQR